MDYIMQEMTKELERMNRKLNEDEEVINRAIKYIEKGAVCNNELLKILKKL